MFWQLSVTEETPRTLLKALNHRLRNPKAHRRFNRDRIVFPFTPSPVFHGGFRDVLG